MTSLHLSKHFRSLEKPSRQTLLSYAAVFFVPVIVLLILYALFHTGAGHRYLAFLSPAGMPLNGLAGICFLYYVRHSRLLSVSGSLWQIPCSAAYALCSYGVLQESSFSVLFLFAVFPVIFLTYEQMLLLQHFFPFLFGGALMLILSPDTAFPVFLLLLLLSLPELALLHQLSLGNLLHVFCCFLLSFLLAGARIFYFFAPYWTQRAYYGYDGFSVSYPPAVFLSRFLPGGTASLLLRPSINGMDLSFGLLFLSAAILYFFQKDFSGRRRLFSAIFTLLIVALLEFSPLQYLFQLCVNRNTLTLSCSFFLTFWLLRLSIQSLSRLRKTSLPALAAAFSATALLSIAAWLWSSWNFPSFALPAILLLLLCYALGLVLWKSRSPRSAKGLPFLLLCGLFLAEAAGSIWINANMDFLSSRRSPDAQFVTSRHTDSVPEETASSQSSASYEDFLASHQDTELNTLLEMLNEEPLLTEEEKKKYTGKLLPNLMEYYNGLCRKLGSGEDLFTKHPVTLSFPAQDGCSVTPLGHNIYYVANTSDSETFSGSVAYRIEKNDSSAAGPVCIHENYNNDILVLNDRDLTPKKELFFPVEIETNTGCNIQIITYAENETVCRQMTDLLKNRPQADSSRPAQLLLDYIGIGVSYVALMILLFLLCYNQKKELYARLYRYKETLSRWSLPRKAGRHFSRNRVYYLSFLLPAAFFLVNMVAADCTPFGDHSFFDEDGIALTLPNFMDFYYTLRSGNTNLSMNAGFGMNLYALNPIIGLFSFLRLLRPEQVEPFLLLSLGVLYGACGLSMCVYMTHRCFGRAARKNDLRLLVPALVYSLNMYMLSMHGYVSWFYVLPVFPLLMLAMERLLDQGKAILYIVLLSYCMIMNVQLALYMCIFMVMIFFTCPFHDGKDFFKKGIRFAAASLLSAGCSFFALANTVTASQDLLYKVQDASIPSPGLHTSFLAQWKNYMIFSPSQAVTADDGYLSVFCGILTLLLVLVSFCSKRYSLADKIRKLLPVLFLCVSFNGRLLSYLWNGMHYQSKVPNRYVFLLMFLLAVYAYEGLCLLSRLTVRKYTAIVFSVLVFFSFCQFCQKEKNPMPAFAASMLLCVIYFACHIYFTRRKHRCAYQCLLLLLLAVELFANMSYTSHNWELTATESIFGNYTRTASLIEHELKNGESYFRIAFPSHPGINAGEMYHTGANGAFNSFVSAHQVQLSLQYGFFSGVNSIKGNYSSTPLGMSLSSSRYLFLPTMSDHAIVDLEQYRYLGIHDSFYVFENPNACSLGIYSPGTLTQDLKNYTHIPTFYNELGKQYLGRDKNIFTQQYIEYSDDDAQDSFFFSDDTGKKLSYEEADELYTQLGQETTTRKLYINITCQPLADGFLYLYPNEMVCLGKAKKGETLTVKIPFPNYTTEFRKAYNIIILNQNRLDEFYQELEGEQLENISIKNDTITGTTNYKQDGYTMLSLAYDRGFQAYIDGEEVEVEDPYGSCIFVKTPAGKHTLTLKFVPYGMRTSKLITLGFWFLTFLLYWIRRSIRRRHILTDKKQ